MTHFSGAAREVTLMYHDTVTLLFIRLLRILFDVSASPVFDILTLRMLTALESHACARFTTRISLLYLRAFRDAANIRLMPRQ